MLPGDWGLLGEPGLPGLLGFLDDPSFDFGVEPPDLEDLDEGEEPDVDAFPWPAFLAFGLPLAGEAFGCSCPSATSSFGGGAALLLPGAFWAFGRAVGFCGTGFADLEGVFDEPGVFGDDGEAGGTLDGLGGGFDDFESDSGGDAGELFPDVGDLLTNSLCRVSRAAPASEPRRSLCPLARTAPASSTYWSFPAGAAFFPPSGTNSNGGKELESLLGRGRLFPPNKGPPRGPRDRPRRPVVRKALKSRYAPAFLRSWLDASFTDLRSLFEESEDQR